MIIAYLMTAIRAFNDFWKIYEKIAFYRHYR